MSNETFLLGPSLKQFWVHKNWAGSPFGTYTFSSNVVEFYVRPKAHCMILGLYFYKTYFKWVLKKIRIRVFKFLFRTIK